MINDKNYCGYDQFNTQAYNKPAPWGPELAPG